MIEMTVRDYIPAVSKYIGMLSDAVAKLLAVLPNANVTEEKLHIEKLTNLLAKTYSAHKKLQRLEHEADGIECAKNAAFFYKEDVYYASLALRELVDEMETLTAREYWPVPTYGDMTFSV